MFTFPAAGGRNGILGTANQTDLEKESAFLSNLFLGSISNWHILCTSRMLDSKLRNAFHLTL